MKSMRKEAQGGKFKLESSASSQARLQSIATGDAARSSLRFDLAVGLPTGDVQCSKSAEVFLVLRFWKPGDMVNQGFNETQGHEYLIVLESE
jgi:hypothetical protein